jgi:hypothetical protein
VQTGLFEKATLARNLRLETMIEARVFVDTAEGTIPKPGAPSLKPKTRSPEAPSSTSPRECTQPRPVNLEA